MTALPKQRLDIERCPVKAHVTLLGVGTVGRAVLGRLRQWEASGFEHGLQLTQVANSRIALRDGNGLDAQTAEAIFADPSITAISRPEVVARNELAIEPEAVPHILIDATASADVAANHARWLREGVHVVSANKLGQGGCLPSWTRLQAAKDFAEYGDSATVGAGLPLLRTIRELQAGGDQLTSISGVLSGSLAWLFNEFNGMTPFSSFVRRARDAGYTEPDPREDLSGQDVRRKVLILARAAGVALREEDIQLESLIPDALRDWDSSQVDEHLHLLDADLRKRYAEAYKSGQKLVFVATLTWQDKDHVTASVGLQSLPTAHPLANGSGTDNKLAIWSDRYSTQPLVIQGPGAGAQVTAAGLLDDALRIARRQ